LYPTNDQTGLVLTKEKTAKKSSPEIIEVEGEAPKPDPVIIPKVKSSWVIKRTARYVISEEMVSKNSTTEHF